MNRHHKQVMKKTTQRRLQHLLAQDESEWSLAEAALLIATEEYPALDLTRYMRQLDLLAAAAQALIASTDSLPERILTLNRFLFEEQGFSGNAHDYYDPRNSFLNEVLERKLGIPITLSILHLELGWRLDLPLVGISFPGRFLVKLNMGAGDVVLDPYSGGVSLSLENLEELLQQGLGEGSKRELLPHLLGAASKREILVRLLRNLKAIYLHHHLLEKALSAFNRILLITPELATEVRGRAELYRRMECYRAALGDYRHYLQLAPQAEDAHEIRSVVQELDRRVARLC